MSRIRADQLVNRAGSGGPKFPHGVAEGFSVSGVVTATSYRGDGSQLTGIDASSLKDGSNVKVQATATGATVTGDISATNASFSGNLTVQGTTTTIDTAITAVDSLAVEGNVGIGTTNPVRNLHLATSGNNNAYIHLTHDGTGHTDADGADLRLNRSTDALDIMNLENAAITFHTNGENERLRITSDGRLLLGTTDAGGNNTANHLVVSNNAGANDQAGMTIRGGTSGRSQIFFSDGNSGQDEYRGMLRYDHQDNSMQFRTNATEKLRIDTSGHILPGADNTQDLGSSSKRFANIYTGDLNLSNEGSANDVDGTWGQYTIQEGEDDLFLINRRTGKKYKFNLTEVN